MRQVSSRHPHGTAPRPGARKLMSFLGQIDRIGPSKYFQSRWKFLSYGIGIGSLVMTVRGRSSGWDRVQTGSGVDATTVEDLLTMDEEIMASVSLIPTLQQSTKMITIAETQYRVGQGTFISVPRLCVNNIRPASSPVFEVVAEGRMDEFLAMLRSGQASLSDHDEYGASLLMVRTIPDALNNRVRRATDGIGPHPVRRHAARNLSVSDPIRR